MAHYINTNQLLLLSTIIKDLNLLFWGWFCENLKEKTAVDLGGLH